MYLQVTFNDPSLYSKPMTVPIQMQYAADDELIEYICRENEQDYQHIGKASDERKYVAPNVLAQYVGVYTVGSPSEGNYVVLNVTLSGEELWIDGNPWLKAKNKQRLNPLSEKAFAGNFGARMSFVRDDDGMVTSLVFEAPEPQLRDVTAVRQNAK